METGSLKRNFMKDRKILKELFLTMLKIGAFTFGGGYAMIALLENEFIENKQWIEKEEFLDMVAIAESTPGPIAINASTYIGYKAAGTVGSLIATVAMCIPSFVIIYLISLFFDAFMSLKYVQYAFSGIQVCVLYLILSAGFRMLKGLKKTLFHRIIYLTVVLGMVGAALFAVKFSTIFCILICGAIGTAVHYVFRTKEGRK